MNRSAIFIATLLVGGVFEVGAQSFSFATTLRAGAANNGDWQIGLSSSTSAQTVTSYFAYNSTRPTFWNENGSQRFEIGWDAVTNRAYTSVFNEAGTAIRVEQPNTGVRLSENAVWTLPANGFWAQASPNGGSNQTTSIQLAGLTFSPGVVLRSGTLPPTFGAQQSGSTVLNRLSSPLVLDAAGSQGSWFLAGTIRFSGLQTQGGNARGSQLQFWLNATGEDAPEPETMGLIGAGLVLMGMVHRSRRNGKSV